MDKTRDVLIDGFHHSASLLLHIGQTRVFVCLCLKVKIRSGSHELRPYENMLEARFGEQQLSPFGLFHCNFFFFFCRVLFPTS